MDRLIQAIETLRQRLPALRRHALKETPTRTIIVDPLLEALGWDVRDPDEVQLEYPTIDGKSVDYALKLNKKPVLLVEAKALDDTLDDVKGVTQVVGYAANDGIVWCILTNGIKWRVYRSVEQCPAPDKLMFEVSIDPDAPDALTLDQIANQMWRFSCEEMAKGTLDALGEETFTDGKVRKALIALMTDPPRPLLNLVRNLGGGELAPKRIKESLNRIAGEVFAVETTVVESPSAGTVGPPRARKPSGMRPRAKKKGESPCDEAHHVDGKPQEVVQLYRAVDRLCFSLAPSDIWKRYMKWSVNYGYGKRCFCSLHIQRGGLRVWIQVKFSRIASPPSFARDVSSIGHWGIGDTELRISNRTELDASVDLIRTSFESVR